MSTFPTEPPSDLNDPNVIRDHDWQAFCRVASMQNHWLRPGWMPGRRSYHWMLTFHDADEVTRLAKRCQARIPVQPFDPVPLDALHLTMGHIGFTDKISETMALAVANEAVSCCQERVWFELAVGPLAGSRGAIRFSVAPWSPLLTLHRQLTSATRAVLGERCVMDTSKFRPHLSIAYANTSVPVMQLLPVLKQLRTLPTVDVAISSVAMVELRQEGREYRYEIVSELR